MVRAERCGDFFFWFMFLLANAAASVTLANLRKLILRHENSVLKNTKLDFDEIKKVTYLYEFDRAVQ